MNPSAKDTRVSFFVSPRVAGTSIKFASGKTWDREITLGESQSLCEGRDSLGHTKTVTMAGQ